MAVTPKIAQQQMMNVGASAPPMIGDTMYDPVSSSYKVFDGMNWVSGGNPFAASISNAAHNPKQGSITWGNSTGAPGAIGQGQFAVASASSIQPAAMLSFETDFGRVSLNIKTGELTLPVGMSRENSIREFWLGFQKYFKSADETSYQSQIAAMKKKVEDTERKAEEYGKYAVKETAKNIADKIRTKYNGQKLIMVKPEDLAKFIEDV